MNKLFKIVLLTIITIFVSSSLINVNASMMKIEMTDSIYKFSEKEDINVPFLVYSSNRLVVDKQIEHSGILASGLNIDIDNILNGAYLIFTGSDVRINSEIENTAIMGTNVVISGTVKEASVIYATNVTIEETAVIEDDLIIFADNVKISGSSSRNLIVYSNTLDISNANLTDLRASLVSINISEESDITGKIYVESTNDIVLNEKFSKAEIIKLNQIDSANENVQIDIFNLLKNSLILALIYFILSSKTTIFTKGLNKVKSNLPYTFLMGAGSILLVVPLVVIFFILIIIGIDMIGVPLLIAYISFLFIGMYISTFVVGSFMTEYVYTKFSNKIDKSWYKLVMSFVIFVILTLVTYIAVIDAFIIMALFMFSMGILLTLLFKKDKIKVDNK